MKKSLKILIALAFTFLFLCFVKCVSANSISKISMDISVDNSGNAYITEVWNCNSSQGTEVYHPYYNLGNSIIKDLTVSENNQSYQTLSAWNTSGTLSSKAYKCGINKVSNGVELCWGISKYGSHTYKVNYTITNFVSSLTDSQMIYWTLIPYDFSSSIGSVYIKIHTNFNISDSTDVWGYGNYGGTAYVYDGYIEMQSDGALATNEYMTILVKFPLGTFNSSNKLNNNFDYYFNMAEEGAVKYDKKDSSTTSLLSFLKIFFTAFFSLFSFIFALVVCILKQQEINFGPEGKKIPKDVSYFRDIPCNNDLFRAYYIGVTYGLFKNKTDIMGSIILKWIKDDLVKIEKRETGNVFKKEDFVIILKNTPKDSIINDKEKDLFNMMFVASIDGVLEGKEFELWCKTSYEKIISWFDDIIRDEKEKLVADEIITVQDKKRFKLFSYKQYSATPQLRQEALQIAGLKRFLKDYSLIKDRTAIEVKLFEEYLIYAQMIGIAKEVANEFKDLYPDIIEQSHYDSFDTILFINMYASRGASSAYSAKERAENYSAGGGGFSSGGGGGGSFGGGGGGGGFR